MIVRLEERYPSGAFSGQHGMVQFSSKSLFLEECDQLAEFFSLSNIINGYMKSLGFHIDSVREFDNTHIFKKKR